MVDDDAAVGSRASRDVGGGGAAPREQADAGMVWPRQGTTRERDSDDETRRRRWAAMASQASGRTGWRMREGGNKIAHGLVFKRSTPRSIASTSGAIDLGVYPWPRQQPRAHHVNAT